MQPMIKRGEFLETCEVHSNLYGTSKMAVQRVLDQDKICILDIDVQGAQKVKAREDLPFAPRYIFIAPPSLEALRARLVGRGTEDEAAMAIRLKNAEAEVEFGTHQEFWDAIVINDDLETAYAQLEKLLLGN